MSSTAGVAAGDPGAAVPGLTGADQGDGTPRLTVLGLFEDSLDAEQALAALRKARRPPRQISLVIRDHTAERGGDDDRPIDVNRALVAIAFEAVGNWLQGLASLIVPERGAYLVAGPLGAALAAQGLAPRRQPASVPASGADPAATEQEQTPAELQAAGVRQMLTEFGFAGDEATYLEHRLWAGAALIAVTAPDADQIEAARRIFADHAAVHLGQAHTDGRLASAVEALLVTPPTTGPGGEVVVADAVAALVRLCGSPGEAAECGQLVVDREGEEVGRVEQVLADGVADAAGNPTIRYVVVGFGGLLRFGRHRVAVPAELVDLVARPVRLPIDRAAVEQAPAYDPSAPFSRREEQAVRDFFAVAPYWTVGLSPMSGR